MSYIKGASRFEEVEYEVGMPWLFFVLTAFIVMVYVAINVRKEYIESRNNLSSTSIKQAFDNLNSGICFADSKGKIVLINYLMSDIIYSIIGRYPQTLFEFYEVLESLPERTDRTEMPVDSLKSDNNLKVIKISNGSVWSFRITDLEANKLIGYKQVTALNVTEINEVNEKLAKENAHLKKTNKELNNMLEQLADHIREQEILELKMKIHNDIGTSLIAITNIMKDNGTALNDTESVDKQLKTLKNAVSYFADNHRKRNNTLDEVILQAERMKVLVRVDGEIPDDETFMRIITIAVRESVTNCIHHAGGNELAVKIDKDTAHYIIRITNNGNAPKGKTAEGGGLSALRKAVETAGGEMSIEYIPAFVLTIDLKIV